jgi:benzoate membrane transport protein
MPASMISAALVAALIGYGSTIALVLSAAAALQASPAQTASWVFAICLALALGSAGLSFVKRVPMILAWSTPGAALIAATTGISMNEAVGAFLLCGGLIVLTAAIKPLGRAVAMIPDGVAAAMLAGVLLPFCLKGVTAVQELPLLVAPMALVFLLVRLKNPAIAVLAALATGLILAFATNAAHMPSLSLPLPTAVFIAPSFRFDVLLGLGVPLYLVTMASQNLPGFAILRAAGHAPPVRDALAVTGGLSIGAGLLGAHPINMAAITAAICLGEETHPDPAQRWKTGVIYGGFYLLLALLSPAILPLLAALPPALMTALVALALLGPLLGALSGAYTPVPTRFAATVTLVVTASGVSGFGIGAAFWGLAAGILVAASEHLRPRQT